MDEKIQRLIESNDKIIAITQSERPKVTAPKIGISLLPTFFFVFN